MMCAIEVTPVLATERLVLRGPVPTDAAPLTKLAADINVAGQTVSVPHPYTRADAEAAVSHGMGLDWDQEAEFAIEHRHFGLVGMLGFRAGRTGRPELACWIGRPYWNRGYATEAVRASLKWVKRDWRKRLVVAGHFADNPASGQVLCKAGFLYTGDVEMKPSAARGRPVPTRMMVWLA
jgi:RimJ/RimL family protein N-acetyltransferase